MHLGLCRFFMEITDTNKTVGQLKSEVLEECHAQHVKIRGLPDEEGQVSARTPQPSDASCFIFKLDRYNDFLLWDHRLLLQHRFVLDELLQTSACRLQLQQVSPADQSVLQTYQRAFAAFALRNPPVLVSPEDSRLRNLAKDQPATGTTKSSVLTMKLGDAHFTGALAAKVIKGSKKSTLHFFVSLLYNGEMLCSPSGELLMASIPCTVIFKTSPSRRRNSSKMFHKRSKSRGKSSSDETLSGLRSVSSSDADTLDFIDDTCQLIPENRLLVLPIATANLPFETRVQVELKREVAEGKGSPNLAIGKTTRRHSAPLASDSLVIFSALPLLDQHGCIGDLNCTELDEDRDYAEEAETDNELCPAFHGGATLLLKYPDEVRVPIPDLRCEVARVEQAIKDGTLPPLADGNPLSFGVKATRVCGRLAGLLMNDPLLQLSKQQLDDLWLVRQHYMHHLVAKFAKLKRVGGFMSSNTAVEANGPSYWSLLPNLFLAANYSIPAQRLEICKVGDYPHTRTRARTPMLHACPFSCNHITYIRHTLTHR